MNTFTMKQIHRRHANRGSWSSISSGETDFDSDSDIKEQPISEQERPSSPSSLSSFSLADRIWKSTGNFLGWYDSSNDTDSCVTPPPKKKKKGTLRFYQSVKVVLIPSMKEYNKAGLTELMWWGEADYIAFKKEAIAEIHTFMRERDCTVKEASVALYQTPVPAPPLPTYTSGCYHPGHGNLSSLVGGKTAPDAVDFIPIGHVPVPVMRTQKPSISGRVPPIPNVPDSPDMPDVAELVKSADVIEDQEANKENINNANININVHADVCGAIVADETAKKSELHLEQLYLHHHLDAFTAAEIVSPQRMSTSTASVEIDETHLPLPCKFFGHPNDPTEGSGTNMQLNKQQSGSLFEAS